jgi:hypothetical protein
LIIEPTKIPIRGKAGQTEKHLGRKRHDDRN